MKLSFWNDDRHGHNPDFATVSFLASFGKVKEIEISSTLANSFSFTGVKKGKSQMLWPWTTWS